MGSPLGPALAKFSMDSNEQKWLEPNHGGLAKFSGRYVNNISFLSENEHQAPTFLYFLNIQHPNSNFTMEKEQMRQLLFLDVLNNRLDRLTTSVYRKSTFTGLLQDYIIFVLFRYKKGLIKIMIDQTFHLNNTWSDFHLDLETPKVILQKREYPPKLAKLPT